MTQQLRAAKDRIERIEQVLAVMQQMIEQEKNDIGAMGWPEINELGYVAEQLEEVERFWGGDDA